MGIVCFGPRDCCDAQIKQEIIRNRLSFNGGTTRANNHKGQ